MPSFTPVIEIASDAVIGWRNSGGKSKAIKNWYLRCYHISAKKNYYYSLGIQYEDNVSSQEKALKAADKRYKKFRDALSVGTTPYASYNLKTVIRGYINDIENRKNINEEAISQGKLPRMEVIGGRGFWTERKFYEALSIIDNKLHDEKYPKKNPKEIKKDVVRFLDSLGKEFPEINARDLNGFKKFAQHHYDWSPGRINKALVQLRMIWRHAYNEGKVNFIPTLEQAKAQLVERSRRKIKIEEYDLIISRAKERFSQPAKRIGTYHKDLFYQFYLWILILSNSGIRPWGGQEERLFPKWEDIKIVWRIGEDGKKKEERYLLRRGEKAHHDYNAVIQPNAFVYLDALKKLQELRQVNSPYVFAHTFGKPESYQKGDPIKTFKKQWQTVLKETGLDMPKGTEQSQRLVPYCLRAFFMTQRLIDSPLLRLEDLAKVTGSSAEIINMLYYDNKSENVWPQMTERKRGDRSGLTPIYDADGYYIGRE